MKNNIKKPLAFIISVLIILTIYVPASAAGDKVEIKFQVGSEIINVNGKDVKVEKPYIVDGSTLVPLRVILEAFGAEVNWLGEGKINLQYRDTTIEIIVGAKNCVVNGADKILPAAPALVNNTTMIPVRFISENFGALVNFDAATKSVSILLEDDGALTDFSAILDSISKPKVGNSYFKWSINVPKGSTISNVSFNSSVASIGNKQRGIEINIKVKKSNGKTLEEYFELVKNDPFEYFGSEEIIEANLNKSTNANYAELLLNDYYYAAYDEIFAAVCRIYVDNGYIYTVSIISFNEPDVKKLKSNTLYNSVLDSFLIEYDAKSIDIEDISTVKSGSIKYEDLFSTYNLNIPAEWDLLSNSSDILLDSYTGTMLGLSEREYLSISFNKYTEKKDIVLYGSGKKALYDSNFNPKYYKFIENGITEIGEKKAFKSIYSLELNGKKYIFEESFLIIGDLIYNFKLKIPETKYEIEKAAYNKALNSIKFSAEGIRKYVEQLDEFGSEGIFDGMKVGDDDSITEYKFKKYNWSIKIPGYWIDTSVDSYFDSNERIFLNLISGAVVNIETIENTPKNSKLKDEIKFDTIASIIEDETYNTELIKSETVKEKGSDVRVYLYKLIDEETDTCFDIKFYVVDKEEYSYCFTYMIQDIYSSETNVKELEDIWKSFTIGV